MSAEKDKPLTSTGIRINPKTYNALVDMLEDTAARIPSISRSFLDFAETPENPIKDRILAFNAGSSFMNMFAESCAKNGRKNPYILDYDEIAEQGRRQYGDRFIQWLKDYADGKIAADPPPEIAGSQGQEEAPQ